MTSSSANNGGAGQTKYPSAAAGQPTADAAFDLDSDPSITRAVISVESNAEVILESILAPLPTTTAGFHETAVISYNTHHGGGHQSALESDLTVIFNRRGSETNCSSIRHTCESVNGTRRRLSNALLAHTSSRFSPEALQMLLAASENLGAHIRRANSDRNLGRSLAAALISKRSTTSGSSLNSSVETSNFVLNQRVLNRRVTSARDTILGRDRMQVKCSGGNILESILYAGDRNLRGRPPYVPITPVAAASLITTTTTPRGLVPLRQTISLPDLMNRREPAPSGSLRVGGSNSIEIV